MMHCCRYNLPTVYEVVQISSTSTAVKSNTHINAAVIRSKNIRYDRKTLTGNIVLHYDYFYLVIVPCLKFVFMLSTSLQASVVGLSFHLSTFDPEQAIATTSGHIDMKFVVDIHGPQEDDSS